MHYDRLETRDPGQREERLFRDLRKLLKEASAKAPGLKRQLRSVSIASLKAREDLQAIPVLRKAELLALQAKHPPFAGLVTARPGKLRRLLMSPGPILEPEGHAGDWWGSGRALFAAGFRKGDIVHNTFSYHLTPGAYVMEAGAAAVGCAVIPAGISNIEQQLEAMAYFSPNAYCGAPDFLKVLIDKALEAGKPARFRKALVSGAAFPPSLQKEVAARGVDAYQAYATADLGIIGYESPAREGLIVNEGLIVEIVKPGTAQAVPDGEVGEIVVTRLNGDYPLVRLGTGDLSKILPGASPCGRSNIRLAGWMGRADQRTKIKSMFVDPQQMAVLAKKFPELGRMRLVVSRVNELDVMVLKAECDAPAAGLAEKLGIALQGETKLKGAVELVTPGSLPNDGKVIADERPVG